MHTELGRSQVEGPAVRTELGRSQVEVQRCTLSWEAPRLRSSGAHLSWEVGKELGEELARRKLREVEVDADMVEEKLEEEARRREEDGEEEEGINSDKSNNPHLAGGKLYVYLFK